MNENYDDYHYRKTMPTLIYTKSKQNSETFLYTKNPYTFQKARQFPLRFYIQKTIHLSLRDVMKIFEVGIYTQKP